MKDYLEYIVPLVGYLLYWLFTSSKKTKKRKPSKGPIEANRPPETELPAKKPFREAAPPVEMYEEEEPEPEPSFFDFGREEEDEEEEDELEENVSFEELLRRFQNPREYEEEQRRKRGPEKITAKAERYLDDDLKPDHDFGKPLSRELLDSIKVKSNKRKKKIKPFNVKKIVSSPNNIRDAFIMKEVFNKKF